jgi:hypothetical protein
MTKIQTTSTTMRITTTTRGGMMTGTLVRVFGRGAEW